MPKNYKTIVDDDKYFPSSTTNKHRKLNPSTTASLNNFTQEDRGVVVFVHLDCTIGSKLLSNFYKQISQFKRNSNILIQNNIYLSNEIMYHTKHNSKSSTPTSPQLLYRGSRDGFKGIDLRSKCCNQGPTLTIIKSTEPNEIFGGFTTQSWESSIYDGDINFLSDDAGGSAAFIFKIDAENNQLGKFFIEPGDRKHAMYSDVYYLTIFGSGFDILLCSDLGVDYFSKFGHSYELPITDDEYQKLGSEINFGMGRNKVTEIEVFKITTTFQ